MKKPEILVIDDDANLRRTLSDILKVNGYEPHAVQNGGEALTLVRQFPFAVALIDLNLPDMTGMDVLKGIKMESPSTQAIILTGNATLDTAIEATNKGVYSYLRKPYDMEQLLLNIMRAVGKWEAEAKVSRDGEELQEMNAQLKALYEISLAVSRNMEIEKLFQETLEALAAIELFKIVKKGALFLLEPAGLRMVSSAGFSDELREACKQLSPGECLCGAAALTGKVIISRNSLADARHSKRYGGMTGHGHIIIPLKTIKKVEGILCLYTDAEARFADSFLDALQSIGRQLGIAVENARFYQEAKTSSLYDPLTGLGNRRFLKTQLDLAFESAKRYKGGLSVIMLDIDHFKKYNDTHGHVEGDRLLARVADILRKAIRGADQIFRYGGEEFLILLSNADTRSAQVAAERLRSSIVSDGRVTISLGISSYGESTGSSEDLIAKADEALYRAKGNGRNRVEVFGANNSGTAVNAAWAS